MKSASHIHTSGRPGLTQIQQLAGGSDKVLYGHLWPVLEALSASQSHLWQLLWQDVCVIHSSHLPGSTAATKLSPATLSPAAANQRS